MFGKVLNKIKSFGQAAATHLIEDGWKDLPENHYVARLGICSTCEFKVEDKWECGVCHCNLLLKAKWPAMECPKGKWLKISLPISSESPPENISEKKPDNNCGCGS